MQWTGKIYQTFNTLNISALNMHGGGCLIDVLIIRDLTKHL